MNEDADADLEDLDDPDQEDEDEDEDEDEEDEDWRDIDELRVSIHKEVANMVPGQAMRWSSIDHCGDQGVYIRVVRGGDLEDDEDEEDEGFFCAMYVEGGHQIEMSPEIETWDVDRVVKYILDGGGWGEGEPDD